MREIQSTGIVTRASAASQGFIIGVEITGAEGGAFIVDEAHETHVFIKPACKTSAKDSQVDIQHLAGQVQDQARSP